MGLFLLVQGCHLGPKYECPEPHTPTEWKSSPDCAASPEVAPEWWEVFGDEELAKLEKQVLEKNPDLFIALQRVAEARALAGVEEANLYPNLYLTPTYKNVDQLIELYGLPLPSPFVPGLQPIVRVHELEYQLPISAGYDLDLWGKYRGQYNSAMIYAQAQQEAARATLLTLTTDLASNYFNLRAVDTQVELLKRQIELRQKAFELTSSRYAKGLVNYIDVMNAEGVLANTDADYQETVRQRNSFENAIAVLIGVPASEFQLPPRPLKDPPPSIPAGIPSQVLVRRPDVAQAERNMAAVHEWIGVAYSSYFPDISLTGAIGLASPELAHFLTWGSRLWRYGADILQMIFDGGRTRSGVELAYASYNAAKGAYEKTVLGVFQEVEDALSNVEQQLKQYESFGTAYATARQTQELSSLRYTRGLVNILDTITSEEAELQAKRNWLHSLGLRYQASVQLVKAIGGGWCDPVPVEEAAAPQEETECAPQEEAQANEEEPFDFPDQVTLIE
jgi:multidrug efflux system outer membrane protein